MVKLCPVLETSVDVFVGDRVYSGTPLSVGGQRASVALPLIPRVEEPVRVTLRWTDGRTTDLNARVRALSDEAHVAHLDIESIDGDWRPFVEYLGKTAHPG